MIAIYKIGYKNYVTPHGIVDKNSGLFEYELIRKELAALTCSYKALIIVNGKFTDNEEDELLDYMKLFDKKIFIASDIVAFFDNKAIIERCDWLLHQSLLDIKQFINIRQSYSYLPEAFYNYVPRHTNCDKEHCLIFGGGVRDNETTIAEYLNAVPSNSYVKTDKVDTRLQYDDYIKELSKHKYSLVISRKAYVHLHWVTARYVEALAVNTVPICHYDYDASDHFKAIKVNNAKELRNIITVWNNNPDQYDAMLSYLQKEVTCNTTSFRKQIDAILRGIA